MARHLWQGKWKTWGWLALLLFGGLFLVSNIHQWQRYWQLRREKQRLQKRLESGRQQQRQLAEQISQAQTPEFIKSELRRHLGWGESGEVVIHLPSLTPQPRAISLDYQPSPWQAWRQRLRF